ncbi:hypothetical protein [Arthrobacter sp. MYb224]|uniref:hypothetical protein n=1 Tax=Arthrobacter sp. MYb224 TaxID=1848600 RepID=UPI0021582CE2|nr:hypothetical protein [Arthrobacter sp. MYb224]
MTFYASSLNPISNRACSVVGDGLINNQVTDCSWFGIIDESIGLSVTRLRARLIGVIARSKGWRDFGVVVLGVQKTRENFLRRTISVLVRHEVIPPPINRSQTKWQ